MAHRARSIFPVPVFRRDYIQVDPNIPGGLFLAPVQVVRRNDLAPSGERFGIFHPNLMATTGGPNVSPTVAWQMSNMFTSVGTANVLGAAVPVSNSLWCWRGDATPGPGSYAEIARVGASAPDITGGATFASFYALHVVDDLPNYPAANVFYGVILNTGKYAIYRRSISTALSITVLGVPQLIATDDTGAPALQLVPAIYGGAYPIAALFPWFSVDLDGDVLIKATLGGTVPADQTQCLIAAMGGTSNHGLEMRAQSNSTVFSLPTISFGPKAIANFAITNPEQGSLGRGQAIAGQSLSSLVYFGGGNGVYVGK